MPDETRRELARRTAKGGIQNEQEVADKFNNWENDPFAREWLNIMMYDLEEIDNVQAIQFGGKSYKSDVLVTVKIIHKNKKNKAPVISVENIQVKLVSGKSGSNQVERKHVSSYEIPWHMPPEIKRTLQYFCGEIQPYRKDTRKLKRMYMDEMSEEERDGLRIYLEKYMVMIISDIIRGRGRFAAEWILVIHKYEGYRWILKSINEAINHYVGDHNVEFTNNGGIRIGNITLQRKGGDSGKESANMMQFKANPLVLFRND